MHPLVWVLIAVIVIWALGGAIVLNPGWLLLFVLVGLIIVVGTRGGRGRYP